VERPGAGGPRGPHRPRPAGADALAAQRRGGRDRPAVARPLEPALPTNIDVTELAPEVRAELRSLPAPIAERVAAHLVAAARFLTDEPERARAHASYARAVGSRIAAVREAAGITAYLVGDYAAARAELRAARRMTGRPDHLPLLADCERGLGHPERAIALAREPDAEQLDRAARIELRIVESGARRDLGEYAAAVSVLAGPELEPASVQPWTLRLWYAYADALLAAGRPDEAREWFAATAGADEDGETDAEERVAALDDEPA